MMNGELKGKKESRSWYYNPRYKNRDPIGWSKSSSSEGSIRTIMYYYSQVYQGLIQVGGVGVKGGSWPPPKILSKQDRDTLIEQSL